MYIDNELVFGSAFSPTATGDNIFPNTLDLGPLSGTPNANTGRDLGVGSEIWFEVLVTAAVTSAGAATVDFRLVTDSTSNIASPTTLVSSGAIAKATLVAGYLFRVVCPSAAYKRYIGANANIGTAVLTAGTFYAKLVKNIQNNKAYAGGFGLDS